MEFVEIWNKNSGARFRPMSFSASAAHDEARCEDVAQRGMAVPSARRATVQKTVFALEQARADIARRRQRWRGWQSSLDPRKLVFIDEPWINTNMAPLRGGGRAASIFAALPRMATGAL